MAIIKILQLYDKKEWIKLCNGISGNDIYFYPQYLETCKYIMEGTPYCFVYIQDPGKYILYPFFKRKINSLDVFVQLSDEYFDITSPYGYSGYLSNCNDCDIRLFINKFDEYCREEKIVSEFIRFHPLLRNYEYRGLRDKLELIKFNDTIYLDLTRPIEEIHQNFSPANMRNIKKAIKNDLKVVELEYNDENILKFYKLYTHTMDRLKASSFYYFNQEYFVSLKKQLNDSVKLFSVMNNIGVHLSKGIFLAFNKYVHYHLGGSWQEYLDMRPNNLLFLKVIEWAKKNGYEKMHLGGGRVQNDNLFRFKKSFSKLTSPFYIVKKVHNEKIYVELLQIYELYSKENTIMNFDESFFPVYRRRF